MIRITVETQTPQEVVLKVEGYISEHTVEVLRAEGERWLQVKKRLVLDLSGVRFIDGVGMELLRDWSGEQLRLHGASRFIRMLLERGGVYGGEPPASSPSDGSR
jgi:anti-anti-sigma regulatory factor